jgi:MFS transporter, NNP family, nitrate/nitrite transporter
MSDANRFNLFAFSGKMKILHLGWMAFFITFLLWFNHAPLMLVIKQSLGLSKQEVSALLTLNVALAIPARILIGMLTDRYGPRVVYSALLIACSFPCFAFALSTTFAEAALYRFLLGFVGAGFVIGIRLMAEWFPANELGRAEGIYGGWGNFGSAAGAMSLPMIALIWGGDDGWRYAIGMTGVISFMFGFVFYRGVSDTPKGSTYFKPKHLGALEVTSRGDFLLLIVMKVPLFAALALLTWKLASADVDLVSALAAVGIYVCLALGFVYDVFQTWKVNRPVFVAPVAELHRYQFKQVAILNVLYFATFGSELAVISMLPLYFSDVFELSMVTAGLLASSYAFMNLFSRPAGGYLSDLFGRKRVLIILTGGLALGYFGMAMVDSNWPVALAVVMAMTCSFFVQSGEGAVFAMVPLIKRRLTGQIAGMTGAYGNVGAVCYLTLLAFVEYQTFFVCIGMTALAGFVILFFLAEPQGHMAEIREDGSVELIEVGR